MALPGRTTNPALNDRSFAGLPTFDRLGRMTVRGTVNKTVALGLIALAAAAFTWRLDGMGSPVGLWAFAGAVGGLITALVTIRRRTWAPATAPLYAFLEGLVIGAVSAQFERRFPGIALQATALTFATLFALLAAYRSRLIQATENFRLVVAAATGGVFLLYLVSFILSVFTTMRVPYLHEGGPAGILVSLFIVAVAALNLVLDFDFIENGAATGAPHYMEWYAAFGLIVTLIWLYFEMLRLLSKITRR